MEIVVPLLIHDDDSDSIINFPTSIDPLVDTYRKGSLAPAAFCWEIKASKIVRITCAITVIRDVVTI